MRFFAAAPWLVAAWVLPNSPPTTTTTTTPGQATVGTLATSESRPGGTVASYSSAWLAQTQSSSSSAFSLPTLTTAAATVAQPPSELDVALLRDAFAAFYGVNPDLVQADTLLTETIDKWLETNQPADEVAGLYRVRGDCRMLLVRAVDAAADYNKAVTLLQTDPVAAAEADPNELPAALLGRARATKSILKLSPTTTTSQQRQLAVTASADYEQALKLTSREEWDTDQELVEDGASRNPYACWEWGSVLRTLGDFPKAAMVHSLAAEAFDATGDKGRAAVSLIDAGIDLASGSGSTEEAVSVLKQAIQQTKGVQARDVTLLQRVIAKESEGRMALAALLWTNTGGNNDKQQAETERGQACIRLEQLQADSADRGEVVRTDPVAPLPFSIDDDISPLDMSCQKFKNTAFLNDLGWSESLQKKVIKLETLR